MTDQQWLVSPLWQLTHFQFYFIDISQINIQLDDGLNFPNQEVRVEMLLHNQRISVCANNWDDNDAKVICRHLGYPEGDHIAVNGDRFVGQGTGTIWLDNVKCDSSERNITECSLNSWVITSDCDRQASVICDPGIVLYVYNCHSIFSRIWS